MSSDFSDIIKQGYIRMKAKNLAVWNKRYLILRRASSKGAQRIEKYKTEADSLLADQTDPKSFFLVSVRSITRVSNEIKKHALIVLLNDGNSRTIACESEYEADDWVECIKKLSQIDRLTLPNVDLLDSIPEQRLRMDQFYVFLCPTPLLPFYGECIVNISNENLFLSDINFPKKTLATWPLSALRRYGKDSSKFTFESGRKCDTGEGLFVLNTVEGEEIYAKVHNATLCISQATQMYRRQQLATTASNPLPHGGATNRPSPIKHSQSVPGASPSADRGPLPLPRRGSERQRPLPPVPLTQPVDAGEYDSIHGAAKGPTGPPSTRSHIPLPPVPREVNNNTEGGATANPGPSRGKSTPGQTPPGKAALDRPRPNPGGSTEKEDDYIYEEKGLAPQFRRFLASRKGDQDDEDDEDDD